ncbi:MAG: acyl-CoA/acyl-ACP dehydrogenase [bacterium]|nr:acyl-CoA/acyl-ACP dehydrogenase [bacterium]
MSVVGLPTIPTIDRMDLRLSDEQVEFRDALRQYVAQGLRATAPTDRSDLLSWGRTSADLGLAGLCVSTEHGGSGAGIGTAVMVLEELASALLGSPLISTTVLAPGLLADPTGRSALGILEALAGGTVVAVAVAHPGEAGRLEAAEGADGYWLVSGTIDHVLAGSEAELLLCVTESNGAPGLFVCEGADTGLTREPLVTVDPSRSQANLAFDQVVAERIVHLDALRPHELATDLGALALAADQVGIAQRCLDISVEYAKTRHQFGQPIGGFQAIKHLCADLLVDVECARSAVMYAGWVADNEPTALSTAASVAKACADEAACRAASACIQIHGAIGYTWEHEAHFLYRRAWSSSRLFGDASWHRSRLADGLGLG